MRILGSDAGKRTDGYHGENAGVGGKKQFLSSDN